MRQRPARRSAKAGDARFAVDVSSGDPFPDKNRPKCCGARKDQDAESDRRAACSRIDARNARRDERYGEHHANQRINADDDLDQTGRGHADWMPAVQIGYASGSVGI